MPLKYKGYGKEGGDILFQELLKITKCFLKFRCDIYIFFGTPLAICFLFRMCFPERVFTLIPSPF